LGCRKVAYRATRVLTWQGKKERKKRQVKRGRVRGSRGRMG
jgi:hypothetical protein